MQFQKFWNHGFHPEARYQLHFRTGNHLQADSHLAIRSGAKRHIINVSTLFPSSRYESQLIPSQMKGENRKSNAKNHRASLIITMMACECMKIFSFPGPEQLRVPWPPWTCLESESGCGSILGVSTGHEPPGATLGSSPAQLPSSPRVSRRAMMCALRSQLIISSSLRLETSLPGLFAGRISTWLKDHSKELQWPAWGQVWPTSHLPIMWRGQLIFYPTSETRVNLSCFLFWDLCSGGN